MFGITTFPINLMLAIFENNNLLDIEYVWDTSLNYLINDIGMVQHNS